MNGKPTGLILVTTLCALVAYAVVAKSETGSIPTNRTIGHGQVKFNGLGPEKWAQRYRREHRRVLALRRQLRQRLITVAANPLAAITLVFGPYAGEAIRVASCETGHTFDTDARNGQYLGLFQMGSSERALYGHGPTALEQARAAFVYFVLSGRDWSPWECKP